MTNFEHIVADVKDIMNEHYDKKPKPKYFRTDPLNLAAASDLERNGAIGSISSTENGVVVTEYFYPEVTP